MIKTKGATKINPLLVTFSVIGLLYVILAFFIPFDSFTTLVIFILITLASFSLVNILFSLAPGSMSVSERIINIMHSAIMLMLTGVSLVLSMQKHMFSIEVIMSFLIVSFFIIGGVLLVLGFVNTGFPRQFRLSNVIFGLATLLISLIALIFPLLGYSLLILIVTALLIIVKVFDVNS